MMYILNQIGCYYLAGVGAWLGFVTFVNAVDDAKIPYWWVLIWPWFCIVGFIELTKEIFHISH
jgi:hypothetical protein